MEMVANATTAMSALRIMSAALMAVSASILYLMEKIHFLVDLFVFAHKDTFPPAQLLIPIMEYPVANWRIHRFCEKDRQE